MYFYQPFLGGWSYDQDNQRLLIDTIDKFNFDQGTWEIETRIPTPRFHCGVALVKDKLHIVGGFHSDLTFDRATGKSIAKVSCFSDGISSQNSRRIPVSSEKRSLKTTN